MQKLIVEKGSCNACGMCTVDCDLLQEDASGIVDVIAPGIVLNHMLEKVKNIVSLCPENALCLVEDGVDQKKRLAELKEKMQAPLEWDIPSKWDYSFSPGDKNDFESELPQPYVSDEDEYKYSSISDALSAGKRAFRDEIYSQADALAQQLMVLYQQRKLNAVVRYAEVSGNFKYETHNRLIRALKSFVNEMEGCMGKTLSLPSDFYTFRTKNTEYIEKMQDRPNEWLAGRIKENLKSASEFYGSIKTDSTKDYVAVSHWFGDDTYEMKKVYSFSLRKAVERFNRSLAHTVWKCGKYTSQDGDRELSAFCKEIEKEWKCKMDHLMEQMEVLS